MFTSQNQWYETPRSSCSRRRLRPQLKTRKATNFSQTRKNREAMNRSRKQQDQREGKLITSYQTINQSSKVSPEIPGRTKIVTGKANSIHSTDDINDRLVNSNLFMPDVPIHLDLLLRPPKQQPIQTEYNSKYTRN